jgi:hypothetical protein
MQVMRDLAMLLFARASRETHARICVFDTVLAPAYRMLIWNPLNLAALLFCSIAGATGSELTDGTWARDIPDAIWKAACSWCHKRFDFLLMCATRAINMDPMHAAVSTQPRAVDDSRPQSSVATGISLRLSEKAAAVCLASARLSDSITLAQSLMFTSKPEHDAEEEAENG